MIKRQRQKRILSILTAEGAVEIAELARIMPEVSRVTLRRDIAELADAGALRRTHGGAVLPDAVVLRHPALGQANPANTDGFAVDELDAVILPPISGRGGDALRRHIVHRAIPFLAESAPQPGGRYLGPDNHAAGLSLGVLAGEHAAGRSALRVLVVGHPELANTRERAAGFEAGLRNAFGGTVALVTVNGQGSYRVAARVTADAFASADPFDIVFAVNDHSAIAAAEIAEKSGLAVAIYATGGEAPEFVARVAENGPLRAVAAFFPEVVGERAMDMIAAQVSGRTIDSDLPTPHRIITADTLNDYYERGPEGWQMSPQHRAELTGPTLPSAGLPPLRIGFMPHYPAHDWYRAMILAMQSRAAGYGFELVISPPHHSIAAEISRLRSEIAATAAEGLIAGETIVIGEGEATLALAGEIRAIAFDDPARLNGLTVITNALDVLHRLDGSPGIKTILTSGEYQTTDRCLVGPSLGALFERLRADRAFLSVGGLSVKFGISSMDERLALAGSRFVEAARRTTVLADHTQIGNEANHRIARIDDIHEIITDDGAVPADRQSLRSVGIGVIVAAEHGGAPENARPDAARKRAADP